MPDITLYHFTYQAAVADIRSKGIEPHPLAVPRGDFTSPVVSLTTNPDAKPLLGKSLTDGSFLTGKNLAAYRASVNDPHAPPPLSRNTCEVRIKLVIPDTNLNLVKLKDDAQNLGFDGTTLDEFFEEGGGKAAAWWVYHGLLPASYIAGVHTGFPKYKKAI